MANLTYLVISGKGDPAVVQSYIGPIDPLVAGSHDADTDRFVVVHELEDSSIMRGEYLVDRLASGFYGAKHFAGKTEALAYAHDLARTLSCPPLQVRPTAELPPTSAQLAQLEYLGDRIEREITTPANRAEAAALLIMLRSRELELVADGTIPA